MEVSVTTVKQIADQAGASKELPRMHTEFNLLEGSTDHQDTTMQTVVDTKDRRGKCTLTLAKIETFRNRGLAEFCIVEEIGRVHGVVNVYWMCRSPKDGIKGCAKGGREGCRGMVDIGEL